MCSYLFDMDHVYTVFTFCVTPRQTTNQTVYAEPERFFHNPAICLSFKRATVNPFRTKCHLFYFKDSSRTAQ